MRIIGSRGQQTIAAIVLCVVLLVLPACSGLVQNNSAPSLPAPSLNQIELGDTNAGQDFGQWVVSTAGGLVSDAYVRDDNQLGAVITSDVPPEEVRPLARSLMTGFRKNFPGRDLKVLMYAPDKQLILTADYDNQKQLIEYE